MDPVDRTATIAAALPLLIIGMGGNYEQPDALHFAALIAGAAALAGALARRRWSGWIALAAVILVGIVVRLPGADNRASDVMLTTNEALTVLAGGGNPYAHTYLMTNPPGGPLGYPPGELAFYGLARALGANVFRVDMIAGIAVLLSIAASAPLVGAGVAALSGGTLAAAVDIIFHATDGSNDTAAASLVLLGAVALAWSLATHGRRAAALWWLSAVAFGWVVAFKEYALPIAVFVALFLWRADAARARGWIAAAAATAALFVVPFLAWNPVAFVANVGGALLVHHNVWGRNLWHDDLGYVPAAAAALAPSVPLVAFVIVVASAVALWRRPAPSLGGAFLQGCAVVGLIFVSARWTTSVYYVFLAPLAFAGVALTLGAERAAALQTHEGDRR